MVKAWVEAMLSTDTAAGRNDAGQHGLGTIPGTLEVDVETALPFLIAGFQRFMKDIHAGIVNQRIDRADLDGRPLDGFVNGGGVGDARTCKTNHGTCRIQGGSFLFEQVRIHVDEEQSCPFCRAGLRYRKADALRSTGDHDPLALETVRHGLASRITTLQSCHLRDARSGCASGALPWHARSRRLHRSRCQGRDLAEC